MNRTKIVELRIQGNKISAEGQIVLLQNITHSRLKILDISQNVVQIQMLHALRSFLEGNTEMSALSMTGLHCFNPRAFISLCASLSSNTGLQTLDFGNLTPIQSNILQKSVSKKVEFVVVEGEKVLKEKQAYLDIVSQYEGLKPTEENPAHDTVDTYEEPEIDRLQHSYKRKFDRDSHMQS